MRVLIRSSVAATVIAASTALTGAMTAVPEISPKPTVSQEVRLAASPAPGALVGAFLRNQLENCSVICPFIVQGATTVPVAAAAAPLVFVNALTTQPLLQAIGTAAASVTQPAQDAAEGIITNDLNLVLPRAQRALEVAVVEAFTIGSTALTRPGQLPRTVDTARNRFLTALNQPLGVPTLPSGATTPLQVAAVRAIEIGSAVAFQAGELLLLGAVRAANTAATTLSRTGSVPATIAATGASVASTVTAATTAIRTAVTTPAPAASPAPKRPSVATQGGLRSFNVAGSELSSSATAKHNRITKPGNRFSGQN